MTNSPQDAAEIAARLHRLAGLNQTQIDSLSLSLDPVQVDQISDAVLATLVNGTLPTMPQHPDAGLPLGLPGAVSGARWVGGTTSGAPSTGTFAVRDWVVDGAGSFWVCTGAGSPGTWVNPTTAVSVADATTSAKGKIQLAGDLAGTAGAPSVPGLAGKLAAASNLSDLASAATARTNLGLGSAATQATSAFDAAGAAAAAVTAGQLAPTVVKTANYTAAAGDLVKFDLTSASLVLTLPTAPADRTRIAAKIVVQPGTNTLTIACGGSDVLNKAGGSTSAALSLLNQSVTLQYQSSGAIWNVVSGDLPLSQLDARFATPADVTAEASRASTAEAANTSLIGNAVMGATGSTRPSGGLFVLWNRTTDPTTLAQDGDLGVGW